MEYQVWDIKIGVQKYRISSTECRKYGMSSMDDEVLFLRPNHETIYQWVIRGSMKKYPMKKKALVKHKL